MTPVILVPIMAHVIQSEYTTISLMALVSMADFVALNNQCIHLSNREECSAKGGTNDGSCASGYGVCCTCKLLLNYMKYRLGDYFSITNYILLSRYI